MSALEQIRQQVVDARASATPLCIRGGNSKAFYAHPVAGEHLDTTAHTGIIDYTPSELVISARAGTPLAELEAALKKENQMLAFEPPHLGEHATLGGAIACGLSGPRRPYAGAARDFVLGINCINGQGEYLRFGGQVMKNVAGYDLSRLLTGSLGTLAVIMDVSLKVLPRPETSLTLQRSCTQAEAIRLLNQWAGQPLPLSGGCHIDGRLYIRLSGTSLGVQAATQVTGGERLDNANTFWEDLKEQRLDFFSGNLPLWRVSVPPATPPLDTEDTTLLDWGGAQRWIKSDASPESMQSMAANAGGHATLFRDGDRDTNVFQPLTKPLLELHRRLKQTFDPASILNPGRMYPGL